MSLVLEHSAFATSLPSEDYHSNRNVYQINSPEFEVGNSKDHLRPENPLDFLVGHSDGRLGKQVTTFSRYTETLVSKFGKITDPKIGGFEVGNNYLHPKFFSRSVKC